MPIYLSQLNINIIMFLFIINARHDHFDIYLVNILKQLHYFYFAMGTFKILYELSCIKTYHIQIN